MGAKKVSKDKGFEAACDGVRRGMSLFAACEAAGITTKAFYLLMAEDNGRREEYRLALSDYADQCTDDIKAIVADLKAGEIDNSTAKLLIETKKWLAQKFCLDDEWEKAKGSGDGEEAAPAEIVVKFV